MISIWDINETVTCRVVIYVVIVVGGDGVVGEGVVDKMVGWNSYLGCYVIGIGDDDNISAARFMSYCAFYSSRLSFTVCSSC